MRQQSNTARRIDGTRVLSRCSMSGEGDMAKILYVGNLTWDCTADDLLALFQQHGAVARAQVITDRGCGKTGGGVFAQF